MIRFLPLLAIPFLLLSVARADTTPPGLEDAIKAFVKTGGFEGLPRFQYASADLNDDGRADSLVLLTDSDWCGSGGCTLLVFKGDGRGFSLVSKSTVTDTPIRMLPQMVHGWHTLIVYSKGKGDVRMPFNGARYPPNPSLQPKASASEVAGARGLME